MKSRPLVLSMAVLALLSALPAVGAGPLAPQSKIAAALGIRYDGPTERLRVGQKTNAIVVNQAKLAGHQLTVKNNDKVELTLTGEQSFTLLHVKSNRSLKFNFDAKGNVTPAQ
jgi:hypothetical protein